MTRHTLALALTWLAFSSSGPTLAAPITGHTAATVGTPLAAGSPRPFAPRGDSFVLGGLLPYNEPTLKPRSLPFLRTEKGLHSDKVQVLFLARTRPVRIEIPLAAESQSPTQRWEQALQELYKTFDRDGDGSLNKHECELIFSKGEMTTLLQGGYAYRAQSGALPKLELLDRDGDDRVSFEEFAAYYESTPQKYVGMIPISVYNQGDTISKELFARLDQNKDGKLSEAELALAPKLVPLLDSDEDECLSQQEFLANPLAKAEPQPAGAAMPAGGGGMMGGRPPVTQAPTDIVVAVGELPGAVIQQLIKKYDKDDDYELSPAEIQFEKAAFERLDANKNGKLSGPELDAWRTGAVDVVVSLNESKTPAEARATAKLGAGAREGLSLPESSTPHRVTVKVFSQTIDLGVTPLPEGYRQQYAANPFAYLFPAEKTFLEEKDLATPQMQFMRLMFDPADFNGDGKLTRPEFDRYFALQAKIRMLSCSLAYATRSPTLFHLLDENGDFRLSQRELRSAAARLLPLEPTGGAEVTKAILQPTAIVRFGASQYVRSDTSLYGNLSYNPNATTSAPARGPLWFRKMDRNGDGDVSRIEFLGSKEDFDAIDTDRDGLIGLPEAETFDLRNRKR